MMFDIAGINTRLTGSNDYFIKRSRPFLQDKTDVSFYTADFSLKMTLTDKIPIPRGDLIVGDNAVWLRNTGPEKGYSIYVPDDVNVTALAMLEASDDWSKARITSVETDLMLSEVADNPVKWNDYHSFLFAGIAYRNRLIKMNGLQIHCSSIEYEGKGLVFSAPSGTGKSTHARMWKEMYGDSVRYVNDDRPAVRLREGKVMLCGTPWSGTSDLFSNTAIPLKCIVMLEQAPFNKIERLPASKSIQMLLPRCFLPYFDGGMMEEAMATLEKIIEDTPVYHLQCKPEYGAVELVQKCIS